MMGILNKKSIAILTVIVILLVGNIALLVRLVKQNKITYGTDLTMNDGILIFRSSERLFYDAKVTPTIDYSFDLREYPPSPPSPGYTFSFMNYGGDLRISDIASKDNFVEHLADVELYEEIKKDDIIDPVECFSSEYGSYGRCSIKSRISNKYYDNVIISPLAWEYLNCARTNNCLLFAVFENNLKNLTLAVVYLTNAYGSTLLDLYPHLFITTSSFYVGGSDIWETLNEEPIVKPDYTGKKLTREDIKEIFDQN